MTQQLSSVEPNRTARRSMLAHVMGAAPLPAVARDLVLLAARVLLGVMMVAHGWQKLVTNGLGATGAAFATMGVPLPELSATIAAFIELGAGAAMVLGLFTPLAGLLLAGVLGGAFTFVHATKGLFAAQGGWELVAALGLGAVVLAVVGPGRFSVDALQASTRR